MISWIFQLALPAITIPSYKASAIIYGCPALAWSAPAQLRESSHGLLRSPMIAAGRGREVFIVGNTLAEGRTGEPAAEEFGFVGWRLLYRSAKMVPLVLDIGSPTPTRSFIYPAAAVDTAGRLHVLWAEHTSAVAATRPAGQMPNRLTTLWNATYEAGRWTKPSQVASFERILWDPSSHSSFIATADGGIAIAMPIYDRGRGGIAYAHWNGSQWRVSTVPLSLPTEPAYVSLAQQNPGTIIIAYIAAATDVPIRDENSVFSVRSQDGGKTWAAPNLVSRSGLTPAFEPQLLTSGSAVSLMWAQSNTRGLTTDVIHSTRSADQGNHWIEPLTLAASGARDVHGFVVCGRTWVVFEQGDMRQSALHLAQVDRGGWSKTSVLFPQLLSYAPNVAVDRSGCVHMVWVSAKRDSVRFDTGTRPPRPVATYSRACTAQSR